MAFRQICVNGQRGIRARAPNRDGDEDFVPFNKVLSRDYTNMRWKVNGSEVATDWQNMNRIEMIMKDHWKHHRFRLDHVLREGANAWVYVGSPEKTTDWQNNLNDDNAGIYTLSWQPGTVIFENWIHDISQSEWTSNPYAIAAIYLDNWSSYMRVEHNVVTRFFTNRTGIPYQQDQAGAPPHDNTLINNYRQDQSVMDNAGPVGLVSAPEPPTNVYALAGSSSMVRITWIHESYDDTGFVVERKTASGGSFAVIGQTAANARCFWDTSAAQNTQYVYRVRAINAGGSSANSIEASTLTPSAQSIRRINCGGPTIGFFDADNSFTGGSAVGLPSQAPTIVDRPLP